MPLGGAERAPSQIPLQHCDGLGFGARNTECGTWAAWHQDRTRGMLIPGSSGEDEGGCAIDSIGSDNSDKRACVIAGEKRG